MEDALCYESTLSDQESCPAQPYHTAGLSLSSQIATVVSRWTDTTVDTKHFHLNPTSVRGPQLKIGCSAKLPQVGKVYDGLMSHLLGLKHCSS